MRTVRGTGLHLRKRARFHPSDTHGMSVRFSFPLGCAAKGGTSIGFRRIPFSWEILRFRRYSLCRRMTGETCPLSWNAHPLITIYYILTKANLSSTFQFFSIMYNRCTHLLCTLHISLCTRKTYSLIPADETSRVYRFTVHAGFAYFFLLSRNIASSSFGDGTFPR